MIAQVIELMVRMLRDPNMPTNGRLGRAVNAIAYRTIARSRGSLRAGARAMEMPPSTFAHQIDQGISDVWQYLPMHDQMDDALFPFVRAAWTTNDVGLIAAYSDWMRDVIQPRARAENTKIVVFHNYWGFVGSITDEWVEAMTEMAATVTDLSVFSGVVVYAPPALDIANRMKVTTNSQGEDWGNSFVRVASDAQVALDHAAQLFSIQGITLPSLHLD